MEQKLSEIILELIKPYHKGDHKHIESLITLASIAWNMTLVPEKDGMKLYESIMNTFGNDEESKQVMNALIGNLIKTKLEQYSEDKRFIVNYNWDTSSETPNLQVGSMLLNGNSSEEAQQKIKVGRNDPCPCGSGKKYKKCCGA